MVRSTPAQFARLGLAVFRGEFFAPSTPNPVPSFHRHNEIEVDLLDVGEMSLNIAGAPIAMVPRRLTVFWAGFPHRVTRWQSSAVWSVSVPLALVLSWALPQEGFVHPLLHGKVFVEPDEAMFTGDLEMIRRWQRDLGGSASERRELVLLELRARLVRLALETQAGTASREPIPASDKVARMMEFMAEHYQDELTITEIARSANLNARYAMTLFRRATGMSLLQYVTDHRVAHARRLLATTDAKVLDVAMQAGFGSASQFYKVFSKVTGQTPHAYASLHRMSGRRGGATERD